MSRFPNVNSKLNQRCSICKRALLSVPVPPEPWNPEPIFRKDDLVKVCPHCDQAGGRVVPGLAS